MASFLEQVGNVARDAVQGLACGVKNYQEFIRRVSPLSDIFPPPPSLWPLLCPDRPPPPEVFPRPPFEGGQCEGVVYLVSYQYEEMATFLSEPRTVVPPQSPIPALGPIGGLVGVNPRTISGFEGFASLQIIAGNGQFQINAFASNSNVLSWQITGITRQDGLPDECGSPPPEFPIPPEPFPPLPPEDRPVTDPDGGPDINFTFAPTLAPIFIDIDGSVNVPVNVNVSGPNIFAPVDIPVNINLPTFAPSFNFGSGSGEPGPPVSPCCEPPTVPGPEVDGEEDEPIATDPPPEGLRMYGVQVISEVNTETTQATGISTGPQIPDLWVPRIGSVYFELDVSETRGEVRLLYSQDYDVKLTNQLVIGPTEGTIRRAFIRPSKGVRATAIPLFTAARN